VFDAKLFETTAFTPYMQRPKLLPGDSDTEVPRVATAQLYPNCYAVDCQDSKLGIDECR
jgi:hypothetical protein